jgi:predicted Zn-dependent protease
VSLINETLKNLDKQNSKRKGQNILSGLNASNRVTKQYHLSILSFVILLLVILTVALYYCWPIGLPRIKAAPANKIVHSKIPTTRVHKKTVNKHRNHQTHKSQPKGTMLITAVPFDQKQKAQHLYRQALQSIANNQTMDAIKTLRLLLYLQPDNIQAREALGVLLFRTGQKDQASEIVTQGTMRNPNNMELVELQAHILASHNKNAEAISILQQHPLSIYSYPDYYAYLAALYQHQGQYVAAAKLYNKLVKIMPDKAVWWLGLGVALESMDKNAAALESYKRALNVGVNLDANTRAFIEDKIAKLS